MIKRIYNQVIRPHLTKKIAIFNGIAVRRVRLFDRTDTFYDHKSDFINPLVDVIKNGDTVLQVGAGLGTSTVAAAETVGSDGKAITLEASEHKVHMSKNTVQLNAKTWRDTGDIEIRHALVGDAVKVDGEMQQPDVVSPDQLSQCDVLGLDCEGAELGILNNISINPRNIIVESHGWLGSKTSDVRDALNFQDYEILDEIAQYPKRDNFVLVGISERYSNDE